jgi:hypothetical protein
MAMGPLQLAVKHVVLVVLEVSMSRRMGVPQV